MSYPSLLNEIYSFYTFFSTFFLAHDIIILYVYALIADL